MKTLHLTLKKKWFDMIASGEKKEEYREIKTYWESRLIDRGVIDDVSMLEFTSGKGLKQFDTVTIRNGCSKSDPTMTLQCLGIHIGGAKPEWSDNWQGHVFIIRLGDRVDA